jgi:hypothetical protein
MFQNFHTKAAIVILQSRMNLPVIRQKDGSIKVNKWVSNDIRYAVWCSEQYWNRCQLGPYD